MASSFVPNGPFTDPLPASASTFGQPGVPHGDMTRSRFEMCKCGVAVVPRRGERARAHELASGQSNGGCVLLRVDPSAIGDSTA